MKGTLWACATVAILVAGFSGSAEAQVYTGSYDSGSYNGYYYSGSYGEFGAYSGFSTVLGAPLIDELANQLGGGVNGALLANALSGGSGNNLGTIALSASTNSNSGGANSSSSSHTTNTGDCSAGADLLIASALGCDH